MGCLTCQRLRLTITGKLQTSNDVPRFPLCHRRGFLRLLVVGNQQQRVLELETTVRRATPARIMELVRAQAPYIMDGFRPTIARLNGHMLPQQELYDLSLESSWWLLLVAVHGGVSLPEVAEQAKDLVRAANGKLRMNQVKLLLKGEDGLASRLFRQRRDEAKMASTLLSVAERCQLC